MAYVNTVLGRISPEEMGITATHEHIGFGNSGWHFDPDMFWSVSERLEKITNDLIDFRLLGGKTFVDCSGIGLGRDLDLYTIVSKSSGVHLVACTGFWMQEGILGYFRDKDRDYFEELFVREITQGMENTNITAGIIKVGNSYFEVTPLEECTYRAAARAAKKTGAAVVTHGTRMAKKQVEILLDEKLDPSRIIISHLDAAYALDLERDKEFCRKGVFVAYDHIGFETWHYRPYAMPDERRVELIKTMIDGGFLKHILISQDTSSWALGYRESPGRYRLPARGSPYHNYAHMNRYFVPMLRNAGISEEDIHAMQVDNPKRAIPIQ